MNNKFPNSKRQTTSKLQLKGYMQSSTSKITLSGLIILLLAFYTHDASYITYAINSRTSQIITLNRNQSQLTSTVDSKRSNAIPAKEKYEIKDLPIETSKINSMNPTYATQRIESIKNRKTRNNSKVEITTKTPITNPTSNYSPYFSAPLAFGKNHQKLVQFAPEVGINMNGLYHNSNSNTLVNGYHLGGIFNIYLSKHLAIQSGIIYMNKGAVSFKTEKIYNTEPLTKQSEILHYAQIPVNIVYKTGDNTNGRFIAGFGPYVAYLFNIEQKNTDNKTSAGDAYVPGYLLKDEVRLPEPVLRRFDIGLNSFIGCEMPNGFYCKAGAEIGLIDLQAKSNANFGFSLSIGVFIK